MLSGGGDQQGGGGGGGGGQWTKGTRKVKDIPKQPDILNFSMIMKNYIVWNKSFEVKNNDRTGMKWTGQVNLQCHCLL